MSEEKEKKKKKSGEDPVQRTDYVRVGDVLRQAREEKGLSIEEIAHGINLRVAQVRAIEEGNYEVLPGTAYATGFIRSYAGFLKLDPADMVARFKTENAGMAASRPELHFPEPLVEGNAPDPVMIGLGAAAVAVLLVGWIFFSGGGDVETEIPAAPAVAESAPASLPFVTPETEPGTTTTETTTLLSTQLPTAPATAPAPGAEAAATSTETTAASPTAAVATAPAETPPAPVAAEESKPVDAQPIVIEQPKSRVVLKASQSTWVQVTTGNKVVAKKVLKPGESLSLPDVPGLSLTTSNAGGLDIMIDGKKMPKLGESGAIVRGMQLDAKVLQKYRYRVRDY